MAQKSFFNWHLKHKSLILFNLVIYSFIYQFINVINLSILLCVCRNRKARAYSDRTITLTLPAGVSATDISWLSMFCVAYDHDFGNVRFPADLNVPPYQEVGKFRKL